MQTERCIMNDLYIQLYNMTEILQSEVVNNIPHNVFHFTELSHIINAALEDSYLIGENYSLPQTLVLQLSHSLSRPVIVSLTPSYLMQMLLALWNR